MCNLNGLYFNISKCKVLTFNIKKSGINYDYKLNNVSIESINSFVDLGITFESKLNFNSHIEKITNLRQNL
jgi:hypothetical protein